MRAEVASIRALTWNVHGFVGRSGQHDHAAIMDAVRSLNADIVSLQEVDERQGDIKARRGFVELREAFESYSAEARTIRTPDGDYGHILMSRWPMQECRCIDLSVSGREPRMAISTRIESPGGTVHVLSTHLGLSARERRGQLALVKDHLGPVTARAAIVLGDFNEWRRIGPATRALCPPFEVAARLPSFPSRRPVFALDRIWCRAPLEPVGSTVATEFRSLSDHLAVVADLRFKHVA
jgi:endonuclease/exonuclease/phosphatase family metal-dependent hydrolase